MIKSTNYCGFCHGKGYNWTDSDGYLWFSCPYCGNKCRSDLNHSKVEEHLNKIKKNADSKRYSSSS